MPNALLVGTCEPNRYEGDDESPKLDFSQHPLITLTVCQHQRKSEKAKRPQKTHFGFDQSPKENIEKKEEEKLCHSELALGVA